MSHRSKHSVKSLAGKSVGTHYGAFYLFGAKGFDGSFSAVSDQMRSRRRGWLVSLSFKTNSFLTDASRRRPSPTEGLIHSFTDTRSPTGEHFVHSL